MKIPQHILERKGARKTADVPKEVVNLIEKGTIETKNLMELLVVEHSKLIETVFPQLNLSSHIPPIQKIIKTASDKSSWQHIGLIGTYLSKQFSSKTFEKSFSLLSTHTSDIIRNYACFMLGKATHLSFEKKLNLILPLADDDNSGVKETAWLSLREPLIDHLEQGLVLLAPLSKSKKANLRRFASEITRPRGVWCRHISALKQNPNLAIDLLEPLKADPEKYVQDSVANWLNDASKTTPEFTKQVCKRWLNISKSPSTQRIVRRALRTLNKTA